MQVANKEELFAMKIRANAAVAPVSLEGLKTHQHREHRNRFLANEAACDAGAVHEMESLQEYAVAAWTEHRPDGDQEHKMELLLDYALTASNPISDHRSDGEVTGIPNTFKEAIEAPRATKWKEAANKGMPSFEKHRGTRLSVFGLSLFGEGGHREKMGVQSRSPLHTETPVDCAQEHDP